MTLPDPDQPSAAVVIGLGLMGCDIAAIFLAAGCQVTAVEPNSARWPAQRERVQRSMLQIGASRDAATKLVILSQIAEVSWSGVALVVECAPENQALKQRVFAELDEQVPERVLIGTNSSALGITDIARTCRTRSRMTNLHFFLPAHLVPAVEVVQGEFTDPSVCDRLAEIMRRLGRVPIRVTRDVPGFLANRLQHALMREVFAVIDEGLATAEDVDAAVRFGFGFRYVAAGPILQKELAGLDTHFAAGQVIYPVAQQQHGTKPDFARSGRGRKVRRQVGRGLQAVAARRR